MYNSLTIRHLPTWNVAVARVVGGKHATTAGRMRNTNNGTIFL
jgi:hypothetical protein